jgi:uncharacterized protein (TIGR04255 family)
MQLAEPRLERLATSPLVSVACEVRFEPCPQVTESKFIKEFKAVLEGAHRYVRLDPSTTVQMNITAEGVVDRTELRSWVLRDAIGQWSLSITPTSAVLETTGYTDWAEFFRRIQEVMEAIERTLSPATCQRVGLRYIDKLTASDQSPATAWKGKVRGELLGLLNHEVIGQFVVTSEQRVILDLGGGETCILRHGSVPEIPNPTYILDFDVFREGGTTFELSTISSTLESLHLKGLTLFQECITKEHWNQLLGEETGIK